MKILYIINSLDIGGAESLVVQTCIWLREKGYSCDLLVLKSTNTYLDKMLSDAGIHLHSLNSSNIYNPNKIFIIRKIIKNYDLVHVHLFPSQYWVAIASLLLTKRHRPVLITTEHNTSNRRRNHFLFRIIDQFIYRIYNSIVCISGGAFSCLENHIGAVKTMCTIENGIILNRFFHAKAACRQDYGFDVNDIILTMVAGFRHQKDQGTLIRSLKYLPSHFKLLLVGDGERKRECQKLCLDLGIGDRVCFTGIQQNIPEIFKMSDVSIVSSIWEGFGLVAAEGMASGKPVLGTNVSGLREVIGDIDLLFNVGDDKGLAEKILNLISDKVLYESKSEKCLLRSTLFSFDNMIDKYLLLYKYQVNLIKDSKTI